MSFVELTVRNVRMTDIRDGEVIVVQDDQDERHFLLRNITLMTMNNLDRLLFGGPLKSCWEDRGCVGL